MSDYIVCPNDWTLATIRKDYMLDKLYRGKYILSGLPKNDIFFDFQTQQKLKAQMNPNHRKIIVYAPIYRGKAHLEEQEKAI